MRKLALDPQDILNKEFNVDFKGYSASEVDRFLDVVLNDYYTIVETAKEDEDKISSLREEIKELKQFLNEERVRSEMLITQQKRLEERGVNNIDVLKRLSNLEDLLHSNNTNK